MNTKLVELKSKKLKFLQRIKKKIKKLKMSSHDDVDVDIDVVSSPEHSPRANTTDDESLQNYHQNRTSRSSPISSTTSAATIAASLLTTTANLSPSTLQNLQNHSAQLLNNQYHNHLSNSLINNNNIINSNHNKENHISASDCGRLSPPRTPETNNNSVNNKLSPSTTTTHSGFTSFSISSILSRQDSPNAKKLVAPIPSFPMNGTQDAAMISR